MPCFRLLSALGDFGLFFVFNKHMVPGIGDENKPEIATGLPGVMDGEKGTVI
jgi:hypothetical protein